MDEIIQHLRPVVAQVPGINVFLANPPPITVGSTSTRSQYQVTLQSNDLGALYEWAPKVEEKLRTLPELVDVTTDLELRAPELAVDIDRDRGRLLGISPERVYDALSTGLALSLAALINWPCCVAPITSRDCVRLKPQD